MTSWPRRIHTTWLSLQCTAVASGQTSLGAFRHIFTMRQLHAETPMCASPKPLGYDSASITPKIDVHIVAEHMENFQPQRVKIVKISGTYRTLETSAGCCSNVKMSPSGEVGMRKPSIAIVERDAAVEGVMDLNFGAGETEAARLWMDL